MLKKFRSFALVLALAALAMEAPGDKVTLDNGQVLTGEIIQQGTQSITLRTMTNTLTLPRTRIRSIEESGPGQIAIMKAREAMLNNELALADQYLRDAETKGATGENLESLRTELREMKRDAELARYSALIDRARNSAAAGQDSEAIKQVRAILEGMEEDNPARDELTSILCDYHLARAAEHSDKVRIQDAVDELRKVIELNPNHVQAFMQLADIYKMNSTTHDKAEICYSRVLSLNPDSMQEEEMTRAYWELAEIYRQQSDWRGASTYYLETFERNPQYDLQLRDRLMNSLKAYARQLEGSQPSLAIKVIEKSLDVRRDSEMLMMMGRVYHRLGQYQDSNTVLNEVQELAPRMEDLHYYRALNFLELGELISARESLAQEIQQDPDNLEATLLLADLALQRDDYETAEDFFESARRIEPADLRSALGLGKIKRFRARLAKNEENEELSDTLLAEAKNYVLEVLAQDSEHLEGNLEMGRILIEEEKLRQARDYFTNVLEQVDKIRAEEDEPDPGLARLEADALIARGEVSLLTAGPGTANKDFRRALEVQPDYGQAYYNIGIAYRKKYASSKQLADLKTSEENLLKSRELAPENAQFALELGILYSQHLAQADPSNEDEYLSKAVTNWESYIDLGGANVVTVNSWIRDIQGNNRGA